MIGSGTVAFREKGFAGRRLTTGGPLCKRFSGGPRPPPGTGPGGGSPGPVLWNRAAVLGPVRSPPQGPGPARTPGRSRRRAPLPAAVPGPRPPGRARTRPPSLRYGPEVVTAVFAHRGVTQGFGENTVAAFVEARRIGADGVELDVRRSRDGALVVHHDAAIAGVGILAELAVAELPAHVPLLAEALEACVGLTVNVEIKNDPGEPGYEADQGIAAAVAEVVAGLGWTDDVIVSSFNSDTVTAVVAAEPRLAAGLLVGPGADPADALRTVVGGGLQALHPFVLSVDGALVDAAHAAGVEINTWTVNAPDDLRRMAALGVDTVITDRVSAAIPIVRETGPSPR
jgi:glycerophosphoryl diester phosphodiesterase